MPAYKTVFHQYRTSLQPLYDAQEATAIAREILLEFTGLTYSQSLTRTDDLPDAQTWQLQEALPRLQSGEPIQYVLGHTHFMGRKFAVNKNVLIPRPETEELVQWVIDDWQMMQLRFSVLDIGSGSGCIPISLKAALDKASVTSCDISDEALQVAGKNAVTLNADVHFLHLDFLQKTDQLRLGKYNIIVSNPPYIPFKEKESLHPNVRDFEPAIALFVADDALVFYRTIADFGYSCLLPAGAVYCELHRHYASETEALFVAKGYLTELRKDMHGADRMLKAWLPE